MRRAPAYGRSRELEERGSPQGEELWRVHAVLNGVLLLLVYPAHVDDLSRRQRQVGHKVRGV